MLRCTCCGRWTVEVITDLAGRRPFWRVRKDGRTWDEYLTLTALERDLTEQGVYEYLTEVADAA